MTTTLLLQEAPDTVTDVALERSPAVLAGALLAEHARLGARVADLDADDAATWAAVRPLLARMSRDGRQAAHDIAVARGCGEPGDRRHALRPDDAAPPVVWAREIGAMQRLLWQALRDVELDADADGRVAAALLQALARTKPVAAALDAAAAA